MQSRWRSLSIQYLLIFLVFYLSPAAHAAPRPDPEEEQEEPSADSLPRISALVLNRAWQDNELAAKQQYGLKRLEVFGTVESVKEGIGPKESHVTLVGTSFLGVTCVVGQAQWEQAVKLRSGQSLTVRGTCWGNPGNLPGILLMDCEIVQ